MLNPISVVTTFNLVLANLIEVKSRYLGDQPMAVVAKSFSTR